MKFLILVALAPILCGCQAEVPTPADLVRGERAPSILSDLPPQVHSFIDQKEQFALALAKKLNETPDDATLKYFRLAKEGRYRAASRIYQELRERGGKVVGTKKFDPRFRLPLWDPLLEVQLTLDAYAAGAGKFATSYGQGIVESIPRGSIYFGGTDSGRGLPAAFLKAGADGDPFFVLTQNHLADGQHLNYLRAAFGDKIYTPTSEDSQRAFQEYLSGAQRRLEHDQRFPQEQPQIRPGEDVTIIDKTVQVSGQVAVMAINELLAKVIFDKNPDNEFFVEESFPLDWMYPHLSPHGLVMRINRLPPAELPRDIVATDHAFWNLRQREFIGDWLKPETTVAEVCAFVDKVYLRKDLSAFEGDRNFVLNRYATAAYSKLRSSQAGVYNWRISHSKSPEERQRMVDEADLAFRQAFVFCPVSPEAVYRYVNLLVGMSRYDDALLIARTAAKLERVDRQYEVLVRQLEAIKKSVGK